MSTNNSATRSATVGAKISINVVLRDGFTFQPIGDGFDQGKLAEYSSVARRQIRNRRLRSGAVVFTSCDDDHINSQALASVLTWINAQTTSNPESMTIATIQSANQEITISDGLINKITFLATAHTIGMHSAVFGSDLRDSVWEYVSTHKLDDEHYRRIFVVLEHDKPLIDKVIREYGIKFAEKPREIRTFVEWCEGHGYRAKVAGLRNKLPRMEAKAVAEGKEWLERGYAEAVKRSLNEQ